MFTPPDWLQIGPARARGPFLLSLAAPAPATNAQSSDARPAASQTTPEQTAAFPELIMALAAPVVLVLAWRQGWLGARRLSGRWLGALSAGQLLALALAVYLAMMTVGLVATLVSERLFAGDPLASKGCATVVTYTLTVAGVLMALGALRRLSAGADTTPERAGVFALRMADVPRGVLAFVLAAPLIVAVSLLAVLAARWASGKAPEPVAHDLLRLILDHRESPWAWALAGSAVLGAPLVEEVMYRGLLQSAIVRATARPRTSIAITSALFALAHLPPGSGVPYHALATLFVLSMCMGLAYELTRSLCVPVVMHVCFNAANVAVALLTL